MTTISAHQARAKGYRPLTTECSLPKEQWIVESILADMALGNIPAVLVDPAIGSDRPVGQLVEVWRIGGTRERRADIE